MRRLLLAFSLCLSPFWANAEAPAGHPTVNEADRALHTTALPNKGQVLEVIDSGGYTYLHVEDQGEQQWIAVNKTAASKGAMVRYSSGTVMTDFHSKTLDRTFPKILFVGSIQVIDGEHPSVAEAEKILNISHDATNLPNLGRVLSTIPSNNYTYIEVDQEGTTRWLAAPQVTLEKGTLVRYENGALMKDFYSKKLDRTFPEILFIGGVAVVEK